MKHAASSLLLLSFAFFAFSCSNPKTTETKAKDSLTVSTESTQKNVLRPAFFSPGFPGGRVIHPDSADTMVSNFRKDLGMGRISLPDKLLHGYYISKGMFTAALKDPDMTGVMAYFAEKPDGSITLVFLPTKMDIKAERGEDHPKITTWEEIDPCPTMCGGTGDGFGNHPNH